MRRRHRHRTYWVCAVLGHDFVFDSPRGYRAHCTRKKCHERWGFD